MLEGWSMSHLLLIEDSLTTSELLKLRFEEAGFSVETAETGEEGLKKALSSRPDLILLDYTLPDINGDEVCRRLKKEKTTQTIPVLFISAKNQKEIAKIVREAGAEGYIGLPLDGKKAVAKIRACLGTPPPEICFLRAHNPLRRRHL